MEGAFALGGVPSCPKAVSYTHLDVYKRQNLGGFRAPLFLPFYTQEVQENIDNAFPLFYNKKKKENRKGGPSLWRE